MLPWLVVVVDVAVGTVLFVVAGAEYEAMLLGVAAGVTSGELLGAAGSGSCSCSCSAATAPETT